MKVYEIMSSNVITITQDKTILDTMKIMKNKNVDFLIIVDEEKIIGSITAWDIILNLSKELSSSTSIKKIMKKYVLTINENIDVIEASDLMGRCLTKKLAVINDEKNLVGVLTLSDIAKNELTEEYALDALIEISCANSTNYNSFDNIEQISAFIF